MVIRILIDNILPIDESNSQVPGTVNRLSFRNSNIDNMFKLSHQILDVLTLILWGTRNNDKNFKMVFLIQRLINQILKPTRYISFRIIGGNNCRNAIYGVTWNRHPLDCTVVLLF